MVVEHRAGKATWIVVFLIFPKMEVRCTLGHDPLSTCTATSWAKNWE
jgi:hypothetical protein